MESKCCSSYLTGTLSNLHIIQSFFSPCLCFVESFFVMVEILFVCFFVFCFCFSSRLHPRSCPSSSDISLSIFQFSAVAKSTLIYRSICLLHAISTSFLSPSPSWVPPPPHLFMYVLNHLSVELLRAEALFALHHQRLMAPKL